VSKHTILHRHAAPEVPPVDGRHLRSVSSRARIIQALLALIEAGNPDPRAEDVAQRAGVGLRTVFRLFRDMESICAEMLVPQRQEFIECFMQRFGNPRGAARVLELLARLSRLYEARAPMRRAAIARRYSSPSLAAGMAELDAAITAFIEQQVPGDVPDAAFRRTMLMLLMSYDTWLRLRDAQGLDRDTALATLRQAMEPYLA
jgi:AcrR family transcriptional regulator